MDKEKICKVIEKYKDRLTVGAFARDANGNKLYCTTGACLHEAGVPFDVLSDKPITLHEEIQLDSLPEETVKALEDHYGAEELRSGWGKPTIRLFGILAALYGIGANKRQQIIEVNDYGAFGEERSGSRDVYESMRAFLRCDGV